MKTGRTLPELLKEVVRQSETKRDFIVQSPSITMTEDQHLDFGDQHLGINNIAHGQIAERLKIPKPYYDRMKQEAPALLASNVNTWFQKNPEPRMVRTLDNNARALLSDRFRSLDNYDLCEAVLPPLIDKGIEVLSSDVTESKLYLKVVDRRILNDLPAGWTPQNKGHQRFQTCSPAVVISNSEVGMGTLSVSTSVFFGGCTNLSVLNEGSVRKYHVGGRADIGQDVYRMLSDATKNLSDAALWATLRDVATAAFDQAQFDATCARLRKAADDVIDVDPVKVVEVTAKRFGLNDGERGNVLRLLIQNQDLTKMGLSSAITQMSQGDAVNYDRASDLEKLGGNIIELPKHDWTSMLKEASNIKEAA